MLDWRESAWFRAVAFVLAAMLAGGFVRIVLGFALSAAEANRGAAAVGAAVLFGFGVRTALRGLRTERGPPRRRGPRVTDDEPEDRAPEDRL